MYVQETATTYIYTYGHTLSLHDALPCLAVLGGIITSTPGTIWVSYDPIGNMLLIHVLDLVDERTWIDTIQQRYERPLLEIFQRSEEHTSELQSLMRISYAVFCLKKQ